MNYISLKSLTYLFIYSTLLNPSNSYHLSMKNYLITTPKETILRDSEILWNLENTTIYKLYCNSSLFSELQDSNNILHIEEDKPMWYSDHIVKEPLTNIQWGLDYIDGVINQHYDHEYTGEGVDVYVIDSGIYPNEDIANNIKKNMGIDLSPLDDSNKDRDPTVDSTGHGTHVASTIAGKRFGVAKKANLIPIKVFGSSELTYNSIIIRALNWVSANLKPGSKNIINMSLGGPNSITLNNVIQEVSKNAVVVVAAGNSNNDACLYSPSNSDHVISVGATNSANRIVGFSNWGSCVSIFAPGDNILGALNDNTGSVTMSGTSMGAPHVSGTVALLYQNTEPEILNTDGSTIKMLMEQVIKIGKSNIIRGLDNLPGSPNLFLQTPINRNDITIVPTPKPTSPTPKPTHYHVGITKEPTIYGPDDDKKCISYNKFNCREKGCYWARSYGCYGGNYCNKRKNKNKCKGPCKWNNRQKDCEFK